MFLFLRLILAHLLGDFVLQTNKIHALKFKGLKGLAPHVAIVVGCFILLSWPYWNQPLLWAFILFTFIIHLIQDWAKVTYTQNSPHRLLWYIADQAGHFLGVCLIFLTPLKNLAPPEDHDRTLILLYNSDPFIIFLILAILASYNGHYMIILFKEDVLKQKASYSLFEKWYGLIERTLIISCFVANTKLAIFIPFILCLRFPISKMNTNNSSLSHDFASFKELALSGSVGICVGLLALIWI